MNEWMRITRLALVTAIVCGSSFSAAAFNSGSTGVDGTFNPTTSQEVELPPGGVFNYTSVNIPSGVTIRYKKNAANTPVTILASGNVTIAGTIDVSATTRGDYSMGGVGGPGGFDGGHGGYTVDASQWVNGLTGPNIGRSGQGPGGGAAGSVAKPSSLNYGVAIAPGGGGAYGATLPLSNINNNCTVTPGSAYGNPSLLPLIGGSGGGGGVGGSYQLGTGGGGGGGAILIAASGSINITGAIYANGGASASSPNTYGQSGRGGGGSGGAIRLVATTITGNGTLSAQGGSVSGGATSVYGPGTYYSICDIPTNSASGSVGRIRLEGESITRTTASNPPHVSDLPGPLTLPGSAPILSISSIGGIPVPTQPTGYGDVTISAAANPMTVVFTTKGVTVGSTISLKIVPPVGAILTATSTPTTGTIDAATASVSVNLPAGSNTLQASVTYTVTASAGDAMSTYAQGERVEKVRLSSTLGGDSTATLITVSGKEFSVSPVLLSGLAG